MRILTSMLLGLALVAAGLETAAQDGRDSHGITIQPPGTVMVYDRCGEGVCPAGDSLYTTIQQGKAYVVLGDDGKSVYLLQPLSSLPYPYWVRGELSADGKSFSVPLGQYVFWSDHYDAGLTLSWGSTHYSGDAGNYRYWFTRDNSVTSVTYAIEDGTIRMLGSEGDISRGEPEGFVGTGLSANWDDNGDWQGYVEWNTAYVNGEAVTNAVPMNPVIHEWHDCGDVWGGTYLYFEIPAMDTDGNPLSIESMSYSVFVDNDERLTFDKDTYVNLQDDMYEFPYGFNDTEGLMGDFWGNMIFFYRTNEGDNPLFGWRIGIQSYYTTGGVRTASSIVYHEVFPLSGVDEALADKSVSSVRYYNLSGQEISQPSGLTIRVTTYSDGSTQAVKVLQR